MRILTSADNRRAYRVKSVLNDQVLYDVAFNPDAPTPSDAQFGGVPETAFNRVASVRDFTLNLARQGVYFGPGRAILIAEGYNVQ